MSCYRPCCTPSASFQLTYFTGNANPFEPQTTRYPFPTALVQTVPSNVLVSSSVSTSSLSYFPHSPQGDLWTGSLAFTIADVSSIVPNSAIKIRLPRSVSFNIIPNQFVQIGSGTIIQGNNSPRLWSISIWQLPQENTSDGDCHDALLIVNNRNNTVNPNPPPPILPTCAFGVEDDDILYNGAVVLVQLNYVASRSYRCTSYSRT